MNSVYSSIYNTVSQNKMGEPTVVRIFRSNIGNNQLEDILSTDLDFLCDLQGGIEKYYVKGSAESVIMIMEHKKNKTKSFSHISINNVSGSKAALRIEAACGKGLLEYDSNHAFPLITPEDYVSDISEIKNEIKLLVNEIINKLCAAAHETKIITAAKPNGSVITSDIKSGLKCAVLGCGHMHVISYLNALRRLGVEILGFAEKDEWSAQNFEAQTGLKCYHQDELLSLGADFALICADNSGHKDYTLAAAEKKLHVIVEKPISTNTADARDMIRSCSKNGVKLMVCFPCRYLKPFIRAKQIIESGKLGDIVSIVATNHGSMPGGWFIDKQKAGGGCVIDHTVHVADIMNWILSSATGQEIKSGDVKSLMGTLIHPIPTEDCGLLLFDINGDITASIDTSWNRPKSYPAWGDIVIDFIGTKDTLHVDGYSERGMMYSDNDTKASYFNFGSDMDFEMMKDFVDAIQNGRPSPITGEDGLFALELAEKAYCFHKML